ncbi:hypothetical protein IWZ00DRAFT_322711 [Phyllosticta capitalensis]|uniref:uncharacterized protein n=1 Tax=Phyllosticta capitalensis TaxID=121624 RepID=UPI003130EB9E
MSRDFEGLKVIWPPDGSRPPRHEHDIVFVHGLHHGAVTDWEDEKGICWLAEHLALDIGTARILAFGYNQRALNIQSDGCFGGGHFLQQGVDLGLALMTARRQEKVCLSSGWLRI